MHAYCEFSLEPHILLKRGILISKRFQNFINHNCFNKEIKPTEIMRSVLK